MTKIKNIVKKIKKKLNNQIKSGIKKIKKKEESILNNGFIIIHNIIDKNMIKHMKIYVDYLKYL